jgi:hypothetical protein
MSANAKRRWFQIHLSTAIVLMFAAGGLMWANTVETSARTIHGNNGPSFHERIVVGFPFDRASPGWVGADVLVCSGLLIAAGVAYEAFTRGHWPLSASVLFFGSALVLPLGMFLTGLALRHVQIQSANLYSQGWPWPVVYWQWDEDQKHWIDFPSPLSALGDFGAVLILVAAGILVCFGILRAVERFGPVTVRKL